MIFAWWKCWPYCESILTASHSEVVRQWDKFTAQADKAASIMCGTTNYRRINENQWKYLYDGWLQAQQCMSVADCSEEGAGDSQVSLEGLWLGCGCVLKHKEDFKAMMWRVCSNRGSGKTRFFKRWRFAHSKKSGLQVILGKVPQHMHLLLIPVFCSGEG